MGPSISHRIHRSLKKGFQRLQSFDSALSISFRRTLCKTQPEAPCSTVSGQIPIFRGTKRHCSVLAPPSDAPQGPRLTVLLLTHLVLNHSLPNGPWLIHPIVGMLIVGFENYIILSIGLRTMMTIPQYRCMSYHFLRNWSILRMSEGLHPHATPVISGTLMAHVRALGNPRMVHPGQI